MDKKYLQDLWNWSNGQDPTLQERYTFEDWTNKLQSEGQYRQKFYDWIGTVDPTHSERRPYQSWEGMVAGVAQPTSKKKRSQLLNSLKKLFHRLHEKWAVNSLWYIFKTS